MNLDRLRWGEWIAAIFGLNLVLVVFRSWYKVSGGDGRVTAWNALDSGRFLLLAVAVVGVFYLLIQASEEAGQVGDLPLGWITAAAGLLGTLYVAYRLATPPQDSYDADLGLYLGLLSTVGVAVGGLIGAREAAAPSGSPGYGVGEGAGAGDAQTEPLGALEPDSGNTWSPAPPVAASSGWSPSAPAAPAPPATAAGAGFGNSQDVRAGDQVTLTTGGTRFPAGTVAQVIEVFGGGALVEVRAADGVAERFEVPQEAYERASVGGGAAGDSWSPGLPAHAGTDDWGFDDSPAGAQDEAPAKTPWWKREIGGGKKGEVAAAAAGAAAGAAIASHHDDHDHDHDHDAAGEQKPSFFKRLFGGGRKNEEPEVTETEALADEPLPSEPEPEPTPAAGVAGIGTAAESDTAVDEPVAQSAQPEADTAVHESAGQPDAGDLGAAAAGAAAGAAAAHVAEPEPIAAPDASSQPDEPIAAPEGVAEPEPTAAHDAAATPAIDVAEPTAPEPADEVPAPEPVSAPPDPDELADSAPAAAASAESEPSAAAPDPVDETPAPPAPEPVPAPPDPDEPAGPEAGAGAAAAGAAGAAAVGAAGAAGAAGGDEPSAAAAGDDADTAPAKPRKRSSGRRKVPKAAVEAAQAEGGPPKVGDQVQLKVGGGKFDAGTKGTVVDVFSAGVIVELSDEAGRTERLDLPFEAVSPADA